MPGVWLPSQERTKKVLLIAIDQYAHQNRLNNPIRDVKAFKKTLIDDYQFSKDDFIECYGEEANRQGIFNAFIELVKLSKDGLDNAIIYFSGHGAFDETLGVGSWVTQDSNDRSDNIECEAVTNTFIRNIKARHILLIADSCFSGNLFSEHRGDTPNYVLKNYDKLDRLPSRYAITSGRADQLVLDGPKGKHSPFANTLLEFLKEYGPDLFPVLDLIQHVQTTFSHNFPQQPIGGPLFGVGHANGQMIFQKKSAESEDPKKAKRSEEIDAFCYSLCKTKTSLRTYLSLFPKGKFRALAEDRLKPKPVEESNLEIFTPDDGQDIQLEIDKKIKAILELGDKELLDEVVNIGAHASNTAVQTKIGVLTPQKQKRDRQLIEKRLKKLDRNMNKKGLL